MEGQNETTSNCSDLESLAAAAATVGYSNDAGGHILTASISPLNAMAPAVLHQFAPGDVFDLSRMTPYTTVKLEEYHQSRAIVFEQGRPVAISNQLIPANIRGMHYIIERPTICPNAVNVRAPTTYVPTPVMTPMTPNTIYEHTVTLEAPAGSIVLTSEKGDVTPMTMSSSSRIASELLAMPIAESTHEQLNNGVDNNNHVVHSVPENSDQMAKHNIKKTSVKSVKSNDEEHMVVSGKTDVTLKTEELATADSRGLLVCKTCDATFTRQYQYQRHVVSHSGQKRESLSLETKIDIIRRIRAGEKQLSLATEYGVGRSTLSFVLKNADKFVDVWNDGKYNPERKRLRGAAREDVEEALFEWYKQALQLHRPITGPILCVKARDFATKLGYTDFKATHGWLDRFKHRREIVLGRGKKEKELPDANAEDDPKGDFSGQILPAALGEYDGNDVFHADEVGLMYHTLPYDTPRYRGNKCAGGSHSKHRLTILMCTNMTGSEKFPLLVVGKHAKPACFRNVKSLPVQYLGSSKSWMSSENFCAWLHDLDGWFVQQGRKVLLILSHLPIHPRVPKLSAVRVLICPPHFSTPCHFGIVQALKRNYRRSLLEAVLGSLPGDPKCGGKRKGGRAQPPPPPRLSLLMCLHLLAGAWHHVSEATVHNSFQRAGFSKYGLWGMNLMPETNLGTENLELFHALRQRGLKIPEGVTFDDFLSFDDTLQVCHMMDDDDIIAAITGADGDSSDSDGTDQEEKILLPAELPQEEHLVTDANSTNVSTEGHNVKRCARKTSVASVNHSLQVLKRYIDCQGPGPGNDMNKLFSRLELLLLKVNGTDLTA